MKIESLEIFHIESPTLEPFVTAFGSNHVIGSLLVRIESEGIIGWGEAAPWSLPFYSPEWAGGIYALARQVLAPILINQELEGGADVQRAFAPIKGNYFAKAAFDLALWDWLARKADVPLWKYLGGSQGIADVGEDFGVVDDIEVLLKQIGRGISEGFPRTKLKIRPGWDLEMLRRVRQEFPDAVFHADANSGYTLDDIEMFRAIDDLNLAMIEQPLAFDDLHDHAKLAKMIRTPICLDETITSAKRAEQAIELGACGFINIKPGRVGGLTNALQILQTARDANVSCWIGGMLESAVGASFCIALATLPGMGYASDIFATRRFWPRDLADKEISIHAPGKIAAFEGAGVGCVPDENQLRAVTVQHCTF